MVEWFEGLPIVGKLSVLYCGFLFICLAGMVRMIWTAPLTDDDGNLVDVNGQPITKPTSDTQPPPPVSTNDTNKTPRRGA